MKIDDEREEFTRRLKEALKSAGEGVDSPTILARSFNRRYAGKPVSVHAARKWLYGEAIPSQDKIRVLADWLNCTSEWLRFGGESQQVYRGRESTAPDLDFELMRAIALLSKGHRSVVSDLVKALLKLERSDESL